MKIISSFKKRLQNAMHKSTSFSKNKSIPVLLIKLSTTVKTHKRQNKNALKGIDLNQAAYQYFEGVDLMQIEGVSHATILSIMSEIGPHGFKKFETSKQFTSWLRLAPKNKKTGGKIISNKVPKRSNGKSQQSNLSIKKW
ncbi:MAG: IS110 family transposase [Flavisolibacter sp.]|nr:IS110 family transposase [Flavisolibacter sp.]